jgi:hypothetical protein
MASRPTIFVSCGQVTDEEKKLGADACSLIRQLTPYEPYFAEDQATLQGISEHILEAINRSAGILAIMHPRGEVSFPGGGTHTRASVWIEQELAIAAFLTQVQKRQLPILAYVHKNIKREGLRDKLLLNAVPFETDKEVLLHLEKVLPNWVVLPQEDRPPVEIGFKYGRMMCDQNRHNYRLTVSLKNLSALTIENYRLDVLFPTGLLPAGINRPYQVRDTPESSVFRVTTKENGANALLPDEPSSPVLNIDYYVDRGIYQNHRELLQGNVVAKFYVDGYPGPLIAEKSISELHAF